MPTFEAIILKTLEEVAGTGPEIEIPCSSGHGGGWGGLAFLVIDLLQLLGQYGD